MNQNGWILDDVLRHIPRGRFDMSTWQCGTSACAAGWLAQDPRANALGFRLEPCGTIPVPTFGSVASFRACAKFLGISKYDAERLFHPGEYVGHRVTPSMVRRRLKPMLPPREDTP